METRILEVEAFSVRGFDMTGPLSMIAGIWEELNAVIADKGIQADESFGVCLRVDGNEFHYIAGIKSALAEELIDAKEVIIPGGKFIVASVNDGVHAIPAAFNALMQREDIQFRQGYALERYIHPNGSVGFEIEVWLPID